MAFTVPTFPILCNIYTGQAYPPGAPRGANVPCNLAYGRRVASPVQDQTLPSDGYPQGPLAHLLVEKGTDIRDRFNNNPSPNADIVECPAGTGRYYRVEIVDDIGRGFPNEHRFATMQKMSGVNSEWVGWPAWPVPIP
jgi:hypothetical protein